MYHLVQYQISFECLLYGWMHGWDMDGRDGREKWMNEKAKTGNEKPILFLSFRNSDN